MDEPDVSASAPATEPDAPRAGRAKRQDRAHTPTRQAVAASIGQPLALTGTPLVVSRSLGPLFGFERLAFKLETAQPTGSWLDRGAGHIVREAAETRRRVLGVVGGGPLTQALAAQCARVGRQVVALIPAVAGDSTGGSVWLDALGVQALVVDADEATLRREAPALLTQIDGRFVDTDDAGWRAGLLELRSELLTESPPNVVLAIPAIVGHEARWLAEAAHEEQAAVRLPLDGLGGGAEARVHGVVGVAGALLGLPAYEGGVALQPVSLREAVAAQRLLAQEEGVIASAWGAAGLAALMRAVQEDRRAPLRARRLPRDLSAVVVVTRDLSDTCGPPLAPDALPRRLVSLADAQAGLARLLIASSGAERV